MVTIVYSLQNCVQCKAVYRYFNARNFPYAVVFLEVDSKVAEELRGQGFTQAPIIKRPDGTMFSGFNPGLLDELVNAVQEPL